MPRRLLNRLVGWTKRSPAQSRRFEDYQVIKIIHEGEKACVYQARSSAGETSYIIKAYKPGYDRTAQRIRKRYHLSTEGEIGLLLNPPAGASAADYPIIRTVGHGREFDSPAGCYYLIQEYVEGFNLKRLIGCGHELLRTKRMDIVRRIARALSIMHERNMIHRDICTDNILLTREGQAKLIDLGFAAPFGIAFREKSGTPSYMSPEQSQARPLFAATDIYSFGVVLFELFTNKLPFTTPITGDTPEQFAKRVSDLMQQHLRKAPPKPTDIAPDVPLAMERIILRCMEKTPEQRYPSMRHLMMDLSELDASGSPGAGPKES